MRIMANQNAAPNMITESARSLKVAGNYDVIVAGGGLESGCGRLDQQLLLPAEMLVG